MDRNAFADFLVAAMECLNVLREQKLAGDKARFAKVRAANRKHWPLFRDVLHDRIPVETTAAKKMKTLVPDKALARGAFERWATAVKTTPEQVAEPEEDLKRRDMEIAHSEELLKAETAATNGLLALGQAAATGDADAAKRLVDIARLPCASWRERSKPTQTWCGLWRRNRLAGRCWRAMSRVGQNKSPRERIRKELLRERKRRRMPVKLPSGETVTISPGGQNPIIKTVIEEFCPCFVPGGTVVYVGDGEDKFLHLDADYLRRLGVVIPAPAKMPDVLVHDRKRNWLLLIEAVTTAGPVDGKPRKELKELFAGCKAGLVFVTAFSTRDTMRSFLPQISWECHRLQNFSKNLLHPFRHLLNSALRFPRKGERQL